MKILGLASLCLLFLSVKTEAQTRAGPVEWSQLGLRVVTASGAITATTADHAIEVNKTSGAATTVNMPPCNSNAGLEITIIDGKGDAATNNITLTPSAGTMNGATSFVMNFARQSESVRYDGSQCLVSP